MTRNYDLGSCAWGLLAMLVWGCAAPVAPEDPNAGESGSSGNGPSGGRSNASNAGSGGGGSAPEETPVDDLPGVDDTLDVPPAGCLNAASATSVSLSLNSAVPSVLLAATDGTLHANGVACTSGGNDIAVNALTALSVGGDGAQPGGVIFDLGAGEWAALLEQPESVQLSFPRGDNTFVVRGSAGNDSIRHAMRDAQLLVDLIGGGSVNLVAEGVTVLAAQLGGGDDAIDDFSALLIEQAAEAAAEEAAESEGEEPTEGGAEGEAEAALVVYAALSLPLVAEGGEGNDWLLGGSAADQFSGGPGDDVFSGLGGEDAYFTAQADGSDVFNGGLDFDAVSYQGRGSDLEIHACASEVTIACEAGCGCSDSMSGELGEDDLLVNIEDITAGSGDDLIYGSEAADSLSGGPGDDDLFGLGGSDVLYGEGGTDRMDGGADGDYCAAFGQEEAIACEI